MAVFEFLAGAARACRVARHLAPGFGVVGIDPAAETVIELPAGRGVRRIGSGQYHGSGGVLDLHLGGRMHAGCLRFGIGEGRVRPGFVHLQLSLIHRGELVGVDRQFQMTHHGRDGFAQAVQHFLEHIECFALVFVQRVFLPIGAQSDALA